MELDPLLYKLKPEELSIALRGYTGCYIQLWHYTASFCMVTFRIYSQESTKKYLVLNAVHHLECETQSRIENPEVKTDAYGRSVLEDKGYGVDFDECYLFDDAPNNA